MKLYKILKIISMPCCIIGLIISFYSFIVCLFSIAASGLAQLLVIFIVPSFIVFTIILVDFLITLDVIKKGIVYSCIVSIIKIGIIVCLIPTTIYNYKYLIKTGSSNFDFYLVVIGLLIIITIPSVLNIFKLIKKKQLN